MRKLKESKSLTLFRESRLPIRYPNLMIGLYISCVLRNNMKTEKTTKQKIKEIKRKISLLNKRQEVKQKTLENIGREKKRYMDKIEELENNWVVGRYFKEKETTKNKEYIYVISKNNSIFKIFSIGKDITLYITASSTFFVYFKEISKKEFMKKFYEKIKRK